LAFTQLLPDQKAATTVRFLEDAREFFGRHGIQVRKLLKGGEAPDHYFRQKRKVIPPTYRR
jgi:hypothetical protein